MSDYRAIGMKTHWRTPCQCCYRYDVRGEKRQMRRARRRADRASVCQ
jgi:hypothetical protein